MFAGKMQPTLNSFVQKNIKEGKHMKRLKIFALSLLILMFTLTSVAYAHSGRTDSNGCHNDTKTNTVHCNHEESTTTTSDTKKDSSAESLPAVNQNDPSYLAKTSTPTEGGNIPEGKFPNCEDAGRKGFRNMQEGSTEYSAHLDDNNNGIACEMYLSNNSERPNLTYGDYTTTETAYVRNAKNYNTTSQLKKEKTLELTQEEIINLNMLNQPVPEIPTEGYPEIAPGQDYPSNPSTDPNNPIQEGFTEDYEYGNPQ